MRYLYLNFKDNLEHGSTRRDDFYTASLEEQYEILKPKLGLYAADTLQQFITNFFPVTNKYYYISLPAFDRQIRKDRKERDCIYNIVIRSEKNEVSSDIIPDCYDLIVIGDVTFGKVIDITVKGIELIDSEVAKFGEKKVYCTAACAFSDKTLPNGMAVRNYGVDEVHASVLTNDFINSLCTELYPVPVPQKALDTFDKWQSYLKFRRYYLGKQSERCVPINNVVVCNSYMITKDVYRRNDSYSDLLLDGIADFGRGEQIILSHEVSGADEFPLIKVEIDKNRKTVLSETVGKNGNGKPKFEVWLNRHTKDAMGLSPTEPKYDVNGDLKGTKFSQYSLGERYLLTHIDIEPDCTALEERCEEDIEVQNRAIDNKFASIINSELTEFMNGQASALEIRYKNRYEQYKEEIESALEDDIAENKDEEVKKEYKAEIAKKIKPIKDEHKRRIKEIETNIQKLKKGDSKQKQEQEIGELIDRKIKLEKDFQTEVKRITQSVSLRDFYIIRNGRLIENKKKSLSIAWQEELDKIKKEKKAQLEVQYKRDIDSEKTAAQKELQQKLSEDKAEKIENETIRRYCIYFRPADITDKVSEIQKEIEKNKPGFLTYDNRAEKAKIDRQEKALNSFLRGYVKNPYLASYLFAPETLAQTVRALEKEPEWCLESLNDRQKLAVRRALASESLFLLQGPPGTGKTQVIAEITAQLCKQGKKVLISSETHKAIDNVFERLPKIPEIRPLRLIPSQSGRGTNYSPERLVDNFYANISGNLERQISRFEHFEESKASFDEEMKNLRITYDRLLRLEHENSKAENERTRLSNDVNRLNDELQELREELASVREDTEEYRRTIKYIENYHFIKDDVKKQYIQDFSSKVRALLDSFPCLAGCSVEKASELTKADVSVIREELKHILSGDILVELQKKQNEIRTQLHALLNPDTVEPPVEGDENFAEYKAKRKELIDINGEIKKIQNASNFDLSSTLIFSLVPDIVNDEELLKQLPDTLTTFKVGLQSLVSEMKAGVEAAMQRCLDRESDVKGKIGDKKLEISEKKREYEEIGESSGIEEYSELYSSLKQRITRFFHDFGIVKEYDSNNFEEAFGIIKEEWTKLERDYNNIQRENKAKIPTYRAICKYLGQDDILEEDRQTYTRELFNNVNVFGITCTSRDYFVKSQIEELARYGIEDVNIRTQGIDVVIIDEVSKSSFLDLLIPILYGKTVILVGDHRQLPPMYDLRHLREDDFEDLDENIITKERNDEYTKLYEDCFFKKLYERVPDDFRVMLNKQYRCHSHIMEVFNHFYGGNEKGLIVGKKQQDDEKQHNLTVRIGGKTVIDPMHHIYFVDCNEKESSAYEGSTSKINEQEAEVTINLLKKLDKASSELVKSGKFKVDKEKKIDERPSAGIICTYGDQAGLIKKKRRNAHFNGFSGKQDEKLIISTVDDFQGDERDIIIVSMVRNPAPGKKFDLEFIRKFERINVALSRARKLLIIVGSKKFLSENGKIDLPDMEGRRELDKKNYPVFKEIIDTVNFRGKILTANDILGDNNGR